MASDPGSGVVKDPAGGQFVELPRGEALQGAEVLQIAGASPARFVVVAGAFASGKTTLLASIYERFQRGPFAGYLFAGSATLRGFERICFGGRGASERAFPTTERTKRSEGRLYYHLRLRPEDMSRAATDVLFVDMSGEEFDAARDASDDARQLSLLRGAHQVLLLVDGERLAHPQHRHEVRAGAMVLLRSLIEERVLTASSCVDVLFTKWDVVEASSTRDETTSFAAATGTEMNARFGPMLRDMRSFRVAAREPTGTLPLASGVEEALPMWVQRSAATVAFSFPSESPNASEFDRFYRRELPDHFGPATR